MCRRAGARGRQMMRENRGEMATFVGRDSDHYKLPIHPSDMKDYNQLEAEFLNLKVKAPTLFPVYGKSKEGGINVMSLFSGCGGMDMGFEGGFIASQKSFASMDKMISSRLGDNWVILKKNRFNTIFANDIFTEAGLAWTNYMKRFGTSPETYRYDSIVDLVKESEAGFDTFPTQVDIVLGGFPCQDFSVSGKRQGFHSQKMHDGSQRITDEPSIETRGMLYYWMKNVIEVVKPKMFVAENVKGLVNLANVKDIITNDFKRADGDGYFVFPPRILNSSHYGVPQARERVIFIGVRKDALKPDIRLKLEENPDSPDVTPYPTITHGDTPDLLPPVTCRDVLYYLPEPHESRDLSQQTYSKAKFLSNGSQGQIEINMSGLSPTIRSEHHGNIEYRRLSKEHGGKNIDELLSGMRERRLTPRECALLQSFPPDYEFVKKTTSGRTRYRVSPSVAYKMIGNAVPPVMAFRLANRIEYMWDTYFI